METKKQWKYFGTKYKELLDPEGAQRLPPEAQFNRHFMWWV